MDVIFNRLESFFKTENFNDLLVEIGWKVISVILIIIIFSIVRRIGKNMITKGFAVNLHRFQRVTGGSDRRKETFESLALNIWRYFINIVMIFSVLGIFIDPKVLLAGTGSLALVVTFAAKSILDDIAMGFFIVFEDLFAVGDFVEIEGNSGTVTEIGLRSVKIRVLTGETVIIPNGNIQKVINHSISNGQALLDISVAYEADLDRVIGVLETVAAQAFEQDEHIIEMPKVLGVQELADSAVIVRMTAEVTPLEQWRIQRDLRRLIKLAFDREKIEIPYSKMVVYQKDEGSAINE